MRFRNVSLRAVIVSVVAVAAVGTASAAQLLLSSDPLSSDIQSSCTDEVLVTAPSGTPSGGLYSELLIGDVPGECDGDAITLVISDGLGVQLATGTGTASTGNTIVTTTSFDPDAVGTVALLFATWHVPSFFVPGEATCAPFNNGGNPQPSKSCTVTSVVHGTPYMDGTDTVADVQIAVSATSQSWQLTIYFAHPNFASIPEWVGQNVTTAALVGTCPSPINVLVLEPAGGVTTGGTFTYSTASTPPTGWTGSTICP